jgi:hypothetical protein
VIFLFTVFHRRKLQNLIHEVNQLTGLSFDDRSIARVICGEAIAEISPAARIPARGARSS